MTFSRVLVLAAFVFCVIDIVFLMWANPAASVRTGLVLAVWALACYFGSLLVP